VCVSFRSKPLLLALALSSALRALCAAELGSDQESALRSGKAGEVVHLREFARSRSQLPLLPIRVSDLPGPQFLISDHPEYFRSNGISLQEQVKPGAVRLYIYHVPEPANPPKVITAVIENLGTNRMSVRSVRRAFPHPGRDYPRIVKQALAAYFDSAPEPATRRVEASRAIVLDAEMDKTWAGKGELVHGFYEFDIDQPARITVFQKDQGQESLTFYKALPKLAATGKGNGAGRGLFGTCERAVTNAGGSIYDTASGPMRVVLADGRKDAWVRGTDGITGEEARDAGNYGLMYHIHLAWQSSDNRGLGVVMTRTGSSSSGCGKVGAAVEVAGEGRPPQTILLPANAISFGEPGEAVLIQKFVAPPERKEGVIEFTYSPPGAACIPTPFLLVPIPSN
jgi:hypothetical protein